VPRNDAHIPRGGDFIQAEGNHIKLPQGLPFVLAVNGGEILVHILDEFNVQLHQDTIPVIVYVEPGPMSPLLMLALLSHSLSVEDYSWFEFYGCCASLRLER
jgi:hypothetical protein